MKQVTIFPASGGAGFLVGDNSVQHTYGIGWILDLFPTFDAQGQQVQFPQAESAETFDRDNETSQIEVTADYGFETEVARDAFMLGLQDAVARLAHVRISVGNSVWWLPTAWCRPITPRPIGEVACQVSYSMRGKKLTKTKPADL